MDWITERIAIGNHLDAQDTALLQREGIAAILSLDGSLAGRAPAELGVREIAVVKLIDGPGNAPATFLRAVTLLGRLVASTPPVLVQCHAGRSRSPLVVAGHLMQTRGLLPPGALRLVAAKRELQVTRGLEGMLWHVGP